MGWCDFLKHIWINWIILLIAGIISIYFCLCHPFESLLNNQEQEQGNSSLLNPKVPKNKAQQTRKYNVIDWNEIKVGCFMLHMAFSTMPSEEFIMLIIKTTWIMWKYISLCNKKKIFCRVVQFKANTGSHLSQRKMHYETETGNWKLNMFYGQMQF